MSKRGSRPFVRMTGRSYQRQSPGALIARRQKPLQTSPCNASCNKTCYLPPRSCRVLYPKGWRSGGPNAAEEAAGANRHKVWRSVEAYASPTANPVGAKQWRKDAFSMPGFPRDLAVLDPWDASLARSRARRTRADRRRSRNNANDPSSLSALLDTRGQMRERRDLAEEQPWELSLGRSRAR